MHIRLIALMAAAVAVSGCDRLAVGHSQPAENASVSTSATNSSAAWPDYQNALPTNYRTSFAGGNPKAEELAAYPELAKRDGAKLKIFHNGKLITTLTSCGKIATAGCHNFAFVGPVALISPSTHKMEAYAQIVELHDETYGYFIPLENGKPIRTNGEASGSPDGHWLASGGEGVDELNTNQNLTIRDMTGQKPEIVFEPSCMPNQWTGPAQFTALCETLDDAGEVKFEALAALDATGQWTLVTTRILAYSPEQKPAPAPDGHRVFKGKPRGAG
ncbi:hypothetical protein [Asticcacaulis solisilvae]|uniref:hypothetical protein n=1 Tax=Asticcacaulis solisilvae TaxID=1217274 RepID=UPI003FD8D7D7